MKATMKQSVYDSELGFVPCGHTVEVTKAQAERLGELAEVTGNPRGGRKKKDVSANSEQG